MHRCFRHTVMATGALRRSPSLPSERPDCTKEPFKVLVILHVDPGVHLQLITPRRKWLFLKFDCLNETFATPAFDYSLISAALFLS